MPDMETLLPAPEQVSPPRAPSLLARLLKIADKYRAAGSEHQAVSMYLELATDHPESPEGRCARATLLEIAEQHERNGQLRQARGLYERLL